LTAILGAKPVAGSRPHGTIRRRHDEKPQPKNPAWRAYGRGTAAAAAPAAPLWHRPLYGSRSNLTPGTRRGHVKQQQCRL